MVSPKVFTITPNRNLNTPKVIFVTLGILFLNDRIGRNLRPFAQIENSKK
jgi:hypothetical protein